MKLVHLVTVWYGVCGEEVYSNTFNLIFPSYKSSQYKVCICMRSQWFQSYQCSDNECTLTVVI